MRRFTSRPVASIEATGAGLVYGQGVYFLGFPFGWDGGGEHLNRDFPIAVREGWDRERDSSSESPRVMYVRCARQPRIQRGTSGVPRGGHPLRRPLRVAGVVAHTPTPVSQPIVDGTGEPVGFLRADQGFVVAMDIRHANKIIDANPIGFVLPREEVS